MKAVLFLVLFVVYPIGVPAYPIYGSSDTGIRRLEGARLAHEGVVKGRQKVSGALLSVRDVDLRLLDYRDLELPEPDPQLSARIADLLGERSDRYGVSVLDLSDRAQPRYAEVGGSVSSNPGSVGKIVAATGLFQALADIYPHDLEKRRELLRDTHITADDFIVSDGHEVRFFDPQTRETTRRPLQQGDRATLFEFLDWMLSASSNAAASTVMEHAMLLTHYGKAFPVSDETGVSFFEQTPKQALSALFERTFEVPLTRNGIDITRFRQASFFTRTGQSKVPGGGPSRATSREMMKYLLRLEQGRIVDEFSSREIKRLLYVTERRIRYAASPALRDAAVYFKSGSLSACEPEAGFQCKQYHGNKHNLMSSIAIVESPAHGRKLHYLVALMSNVLRRNSALDHQSLATSIHRLIEQSHPTTRSERN